MPPWTFFSNTGSSSSTPNARTPSGLADRNAGYFSTSHRVEDEARDYLSPGDFHPSAGPSSSRDRDRPHARSLSNNIPPIFGANRRRQGPTNESGLGSGQPEANHRPTSSPRRQPNRAAVDESELDSGKCATCNSKARWPRGLLEFRCTQCLMLNDLKPKAAHGVPGEQDAGIQRSGTYPPSRSYLFNIAPVDVAHSKALEERCLDAFLQARKFQLAARIKNPTTSSALPSSPPALQAEASTSKSLSSGTIKRKPVATSADILAPLPPSDSALSSSPKNFANLSLTSKTPDEVHEGTLNASWVLPRIPQTGDISFESSNLPVQTPAQPTRRPPLPPPYSPPTTQRSPLTQQQGPSQASSSNQASGQPLSRDEAFQFSEEASSGLDSQLAKSIFKPLEDYMTQSFGQWECLNASFATFRRRTAPARTGETLPERPRHQHETHLQPEPILSEVDAKTLLLGDVAENGLWWTGKDDWSKLNASRPKNERTQSPHELVHTKSPRINWEEANQWYQIVCQAGGKWRDRWYSLLESAGLSSLSSQVVAEETAGIEDALAEARNHVQRCLLKISESLLKRPGRPLKEPSHLRFLLILLMNPLLHPDYRTAEAESRSQTLQLPSAALSKNESRVPREEKAPARLDSLKPRESNPSFNVLKRILGLLSNLSNECHRHLSAWFARYPELQFRDHVNLIQSFINHRLKRTHGRKRSGSRSTFDELIPNLSGTGQETSAELHAALGLSSKPRASGNDSTTGRIPSYCDDWQVKAAARVMALLWSANRNFRGEKAAAPNQTDRDRPPGSRDGRKQHAQLLATTEFYNNMVELSDLIADFDMWESAQGRFSFCQYPFFLSVGAKIRIMDHDAKRQMEVKAREAFFNSILKNRVLDQYLVLKVRRDCLVEDSLKSISEVVGTGQEEIKKGLRIQFVGEEGVDAGGLRKEWFLLLVREIFDPRNGMFVYDEDSQICYFNPYSFEPSEQFFLVGALLGLAIYNSTILDIALPLFLFKKLLAAGSSQSSHHQNAVNRVVPSYTLEDLSEYRPALANGLRQLLEFDGDVEQTFCRDFVAEVQRYGQIQVVPLCSNGENRAVTSSNRQEFVDLYVRYLLDKSVARQFEPFKRGFMTVCGGNALSLFQPEEIEVLVRGSDERLDVPSLKAVAEYDNWRRGQQDIENPAEEVSQIRWFWEFLEQAESKDQRKTLSFITGSDRIPAMGATSLVIKIAYAGRDYTRYPIARTCFNLLLLYKYRTKEELVQKLWRAICDSEGFGLK